MLYDQWIINLCYVLELFFIHDGSCLKYNYHFEQTSFDFTSDLSGLSWKYSYSRPIHATYMLHMHTLSMSFFGLMCMTIVSG